MTRHHTPFLLAVESSTAISDPSNDSSASLVLPSPPIAYDRTARRSLPPSSQVKRDVDPTLAQRFLRHEAQMSVAEWRATWEAAFVLVFSRFSGEDVVVFGVAEHEPRGASARAIVQRVDCADSTTAAALVSELGQSGAAAPALASTDLGAVDKFLTVLPRRGASAVAAPTARPSAQSAQPVSLHVTVALTGPDSPRLLAVHDPQRLSADTCARMLAALEHVADEILRDPARPLGHIHLLPPLEEKQILFDWNSTERPLPAEVGIHALFERRAQACPSAVALEADGASLTYGELELRANQMAHALIERGARPGGYVGVCLERGANLIVTLLGVAKSGAAYVPLDPSFPPERIARMRTIAGVNLVVTEPHLRHIFDGASIIALDARGLPGGERLPASRAAPRRSATDPCYAIFTSGSTGEPKAVVMSHRAVFNTLDWVSRELDVRAGDRLLFVNSPSFDLSVYDVFGVLGAGGTVVVASAGVLNCPESLARDLVDKRINIWNSVPAGLERILPFVPAERREDPGERREDGEPRGDHRHLRLVLLSGDWIPLHLPAAVRAAFPNAEVVALGGATEAAIWSNAFRVGVIDPTWQSVPYGRPIQNARYHILDRRLHPVPVGVVGDLSIGGTCLADGYLNRPELTAERFVADPFRAGERLYRTGDRARYFPDGQIEFLGRADHQVKICGYRVELAEIETVLSRQPGVRAAVCVAFPDTSGQNGLAAYVVLEVPGSTTPAALRGALARCLPPFMVPAHLAVCESLPLMPNGKVERRPIELRKRIAKQAAKHAALPMAEEPATDGRRADADSPGERSLKHYERTLRELWQELFDLPAVGLHDNFYELGGHSLLAVKMIVTLRTRLRRDVPLSALVGHSTVAKLAAFLWSRAHGAEPNEPVTSQTLAGSRANPALSASPAARDTRQTPHLFALNETGTNPPLILIAGVGGYAFTFRNLPRFLGPDQPVYAFQAVGAEPSEPLRPRSIEEIAEIYEAELEQVLPGGGPVVLGGFSFGAVPAFELARRLARKGRHVPLLVSLDGFAPLYPRRLGLGQRLWTHGRELLAGGPAARRAYLAKTRENLRARLLRARGREAELSPDLHLDEELNTRAKHLWVENLRALERYRPANPIDSALLLVRVEQPERWFATRMDDPLYGWERFVKGPIMLTSLPGSHTSLLESTPNQKAAADTIAKHIAGIA